MRASNGLSRRDMMRLMGAAGLAMTGGATSAFAQAAGRIESTAPELANIINTSEPIRQLATGFGGDIGPAEGPLWISDGRYLLFGSNRGGQTAAVLLSFVATCKGCGVEPFAWFRDVLTRIATHPVNRLAELLPHNWKALMASPA